MKKINQKKCLVAALVACGTTVGMITTAHAQIITDTYTDANGTAITAHTPDANEPAGTYAAGGQGYGPNSGHPTIVGDELQLDTNTGDAISISSSGSYTKPTQLTISEDLSIDQITQETGNNRGVGLGFFSAAGVPSDASSLGDFTGILLGTDGALKLIVGGSYYYATLPTVAYDAADFGGAAFDASAFYTLSYSVNTSTGGISGLTLSNGSGSESASFSTTVFTNTQTAYAGTVATAAQGNQSGLADNFSLTGPAAVPEPSAWAMMLAGVVSLVGLRRFTRKV